MLKNVAKQDTFPEYIECFSISALKEQCHEDFTVLGHLC